MQLTGIISNYLILGKEAVVDSKEAILIGMRYELKTLIHDEKVVTAKVQKMRLQALTLKYAATKAEMLASRWGKMRIPELLKKLLQRNMAVKNTRAKEAQNLSMKADEARNIIHESKRALIINLSKETGFELPAGVSQKDIEESTEGQQLQSLLKELEKAQAALREASPKTKFIEQTAALKYKNAVENAIIRIEENHIKPLLYEPKAKGFKKAILLVDTFLEMVRKVVEKEITQIPPYDVSKYGELVNFVPSENNDIIEQTWISRPFSLITILYDRRTHQNLYYISEPDLNSFEDTLVRKVRDSLKILLLETEVDLRHMNKELVLYNSFIRILDLYGIELTPVSRYKIWYYIKREYVGSGKLDVLLKDPMIEDISVVGSDTPVYLYHRKYMNIPTNMIFGKEELDQMIMKLAQASGKTISLGYPIMNASLPDGSRIEATIGQEVTTRGGTITIRKFREVPLTPIDLIKYETFNTEIMAYLWFAVENNKSMIFVGGTASGKTSTLNAVSLFIPSDSKIISIEDTRELTLYHKNWIPGIVREAFAGQEEIQVIDMFELLRSALRQRPEYLLVGEVRGKEAYTLFQAMSTGHTTFSTMHAGDIQSAVNRLINEPINVPVMMLSAMDIMIVQVLRNMGRKRVRRMDTLSEFMGIDAATGDISTREVYKWDPVHDRMKASGTSKVLDDIMHMKGWGREQLNKELDNRRAVLAYMIDRDINDYRDVSYIIQLYSSDNENLLSFIREGKDIPLGQL